MVFGYHSTTGPPTCIESWNDNRRIRGSQDYPAVYLCTFLEFGAGNEKLDQMV
jgi:hypothetical protein